MGNSSSNWQPQPLAPVLEQPEILTAVAQSLPGAAATRKSAAYWAWKHVDNPFGRSGGTFGRADDGDIVGVRSFMRWGWRTSDGQALRAVRAVDTSTSPDWRGKGVFTRLTLAAIEELKREGVDLIFNTPNSASGPGYVKMGWQSVGTMPLSLRPIRPFRLLRGMLKRGGADDRLPDPADFGLGELPSASQWLSDPAAMDLVDSHEKSRSVLGLRTPRDRNYLDWRYARHPQVPYRVHVMELDGAPAAVAVVRPNWRFGLRELVVTELFARDARRDLLRRCLGSLARVGRPDYLITHFAKGSVELAAARRAGFLPAPGQGIGLYARHVEAALSAQLLAPSGWDLSLGDLELF